MSVSTHRLEAALTAYHNARKPSWAVALSMVAPWIAATGYTREADALVGVNRDLSTSPWLWYRLGPYTRRLPGAVAARNGPRVLQMLNDGAPATAEALSEACKNDSLSILEELVRRGAPVRPRHLFEALEGGHQRLLPPLCEAIRTQMEAEDAEAVPSPAAASRAAWGLSDRVRLIDRKNEDGMTALMLAAQLGQVESVWALVDAGADINAWRNMWRYEQTDKYARSGSYRESVLDVAEASASPYKGQITAFLRRRGAKRAVNPRW